MPFPSTFTGVIEMFTDLGLKVIPFLATLAFLVFVWGVAKFIRSSGSEAELQKSRNFLIYGIVGLFVLVSLYGIITFLRKEFGFTGTLGIPQVHF